MSHIDWYTNFNLYGKKPDIYDLKFSRTSSDKSDFVSMNDLRHKINVQHEINKMLGVKRVIFNDPATIVFWKDGTKTIVKCSENEKFNPYVGFCAAVTKKVYGNNSRIQKYVKQGFIQPKIEEEPVKEEPAKPAKKKERKKTKNG